MLAGQVSARKPQAAFRVSSPMGSQRYSGAGFVSRGDPRMGSVVGSEWLARGEFPRNRRLPEPSPSFAQYLLTVVTTPSEKIS